VVRSSEEDNPLLLSLSQLTSSGKIIVVIPLANSKATMARPNGVMFVVEEELYSLLGQ
jgi:hypothetical protein